MPTPQAQPPLQFISPHYTAPIYWGLRSVLPLWLRTQTQIPEIQVQELDRLVDLYQQFQAGKIRFLLAFRHPTANDPLCLFHLLAYDVPRRAKQQGVKLMPTHAHFIYDRGIPLWAGQYMGWLYSRLGATPIRRGKVDRAGLRSARDLFATGQFPLAAAPEGATNGHSELVSPIEPGIAQFGFWCVEDLQKAGRSETVYIVPIGLRYEFITPPWKALEALLRNLEAESGLPVASDSLSDPPTEAQRTALYKRLFQLGEHLLTLMEGFYRKFYAQTIASEKLAEATTPNEHLAQRLRSLLNTALLVAEQYFGLPAKGSITDRCRRLEQAGWDWIYREDIKDLDALPPIERGLADRIAEEANLRLWHMRIVETFVSVTGNYVLEHPTADRFAETALLLWDMVMRLKGKTPFPRPVLGKQRAILTIESSISVTDRWTDYQRDRRQAVTQLSQDLQIALQPKR